MTDITNYLKPDRPFVIAEIGNNHEGDMGVARDLIHAAKDAGVDAVKFQAIIPQTLVSADQVQRIAQLTKFCFSIEQFKELADLAKQLGLEFFTSVFDRSLIAALSEVQQLFKISSGDNTYTDLIEAVAATTKPAIISTGGLCLTDINTLVADFLAKAPESQLAILHCVSNYPTLPENAQLSMIAKIKHQHPNIVVGYSDHTLGNQACYIAAALGAQIIEKHFTLDHNYSDFRDHQLSADPKQMKELMQMLPDVSAMIGTGKQDLDRSDIDMLGVRRKAIASCSVKSGEMISQENIHWSRITENTGISDRSSIYGKVARENIAKGEVISPEMIID